MTPSAPSSQPPVGCVSECEPSSSAVHAPVNSVMSGFSNKLKTQLHGTGGDLTMHTEASGGFPHTAADIERLVPGVTAQSRSDFVAQERRIVISWAVVALFMARQWGTPL